MNIEFSLKSKNVIITGASSGIGRETAYACAELGASLYLIDLNEPTGLVTDLTDMGNEVIFFEADVSDRGSIENIIGNITVIDAVVANAAICPWDDWYDDDWDDVFLRVIDVNVLGVLHLMRACLPKMYEREGGNVVLVGSVAGRMGGLRSAPHYIASKGGINALVKWLSRKSAPYGVIVNAVSPGATATDMTANQSYDTSSIPLGRVAHPREVALPISFLCSGAASYICGATLDVNGGVYMT